MLETAEADGIRPIKSPSQPPGTYLEMVCGLVTFQNHLLKIEQVMIILLSPSGELPNCSMLPTHYHLSLLCRSRARYTEVVYWEQEAILQFIRKKKNTAVCILRTVWTSIYVCIQYIYTQLNSHLCADTWEDTRKTFLQTLTSLSGLIK